LEEILLLKAGIGWILKLLKKTVLLKSWKIKELKELEDNFRSSAIIEEEEDE